MLNCQARQTTDHHFEIKKSTEKQQNYRVETDLNNVTGAENFKINQKKTSSTHCQSRQFMEEYIQARLHFMIVKIVLSGTLLRSELRVQNQKIRLNSSRMFERQSESIYF